MAGTMSTVEKRRRRMVGPTHGPSGCEVEAALGWLDTADVTLSQLPSNGFLSLSRAPSRSRSRRGYCSTISGDGGSDTGGGMVAEILVGTCNWADHKDFYHLELVRGRRR